MTREDWKIAGVVGLFVGCGVAGVLFGQTGTPKLPQEFADEQEEEAARLEEIFKQCQEDGGPFCEAWDEARQRAEAEADKAETLVPS